MAFSEIQMRVETLVQELSLNSDLVVTSFIAGVALTFILLVLYLGQRRRSHKLEIQNKRLTDVATRAKEILTTTPDGLFLWDRILGGIACSSRLAELLGLEAGTNARFDDIRNCFEGNSLKDFERNVSSLRGNGTPFSILLTFGQKTLEVVGSRAQTKTGQPVADIVWVRDVSKLSNNNENRNSNNPQNPLTKNTSGLDDRHLTALLDAIPIPIWLRDSKLHIAFTNRASESIANPDSSMAEKARIQGEACTERLTLQIDGSPRIMDITEISLGASGNDFNGKQKLGGSVGFAIDRLEHTEIETLNQQNITQDTVLQTLDTAIAIFDTNQRLNFSNASFAKLFDIDREWLANKPTFLDILDRLRETRNLPEVSDFQAFKTNLEDYFDTLSTPLSDLMHLPDGRTLKQTISPHPNGSLIFAFNDVSQKLALERSMKEASAVQRETLDNLQEGIAVFGSDGRLKLFNPVYMRIWELNIEQLKEEPHISQIIDQTRKMFPPPKGEENWDDSKWHNHRDSMAIQMLSRTSTSGQMHLANGSVINHSSIPLPDGAILLCFLNVTDSARVEEALRVRAEALEEADHLKTEFIAKLSYEMRTPLNTVIGFADMLSQNLFGELNSRQSEYAKGILNTSQNLVSILNDILDLASIEAGQLELDKDTFDTHAFLVDSLNFVKERAQRKKQRLLFDCPPDIGWILGDEKRLKQVLFNLLSNAVSFTPSHGEIKLKARRLKSEIEFSVQDSGVGIPSDARKRLFRPFEQGETNPDEDILGPTTSGKGLGLSIVRNFIELHGGSVDVKSQPGRGTTITCHIPTDTPKGLNSLAFQISSETLSDNQDQAPETTKEAASTLEPNHMLEKN